MNMNDARTEARISKETMCRFAPYFENLVVGIIALSPKVIVRWILTRYVLQPLRTWRAGECPNRPGLTNPLLELPPEELEHGLLGLVPTAELTQSIHDCGRVLVEAYRDVTLSEFDPQQDPKVSEGRGMMDYADEVARARGYVLEATE